MKFFSLCFRGELKLSYVNAVSYVYNCFSFLQAIAEAIALPFLNSLHHLILPSMATGSRQSMPE